MAKIILFCYRFTDGLRAYFLKGNSPNHVVAKPNEIVHFPQLKVDKYNYKDLKIPYATWLKRIQVSQPENQKSLARHGIQDLPWVKTKID